ncbi:MAG: DEAD/DEAH box helicase family protein [Acetobacteraceae bacterium]|nr:DEAD/DEAH box helicase family protein [Acetobacteraceae bacterium]MBV8521930.1 DEAD/DEAH box helicase family protein [Acetobacteraceae bacterium]
MFESTIHAFRRFRLKRSCSSFGDYPPDFFDFIIIDECHRGGANDESTWRGILEYFSPAVQLGLTATPKRRFNADTYAYFGEPVFIYSLKNGINDGFLTPFKVRQIATTLDDYLYTRDDELIEGEIEEGRRYTERDFNRNHRIAARKRYRIKLLIDELDQSQRSDLLHTRSSSRYCAATSLPASEAGKAKANTPLPEPSVEVPAVTNK